MSVSSDLKVLAKLCSVSATKCLERKLALGPKPDDPAEAMVWEQQRTRLSGQIDSLSAMNIKIASASVAAALDEFGDELAAIATSSRNAQAAIRKIKEVSLLLTKVSRVLDLGLAVLAAAAAPGASSVAAALEAAGALDA